MINLSIPVSNFDLDKKAPTWKKFLNEITDGNKELISFLQRLFGYALSGSGTYHIFPVFYGSGRNGKGTLMETIASILTLELAIAIEVAVLEQKRFSNGHGPTPTIADVKGKRIVWADEWDESKVLDTATVKSWTGGNTLSGRDLYKSNSRFKSSHVLFLLTNNIPMTKHRDQAYMDRLLLVEFPNRFVDNPTKVNEYQVDRTLCDKLWRERPGILAWMVRGYLEWLKQGLNPPDCVKPQHYHAKLVTDQVKEFMLGACERIEGSKEKVGTLYKRYKYWCSLNNLVAETLTTFGKYLDLLGYKKMHSAYVYVLGIRLKD